MWVTIVSWLIRESRKRGTMPTAILLAIAVVVVVTKAAAEAANIAPLPFCRNLRDDEAVVAFADD